jgi:hypothetical protein
VDRTLTGCLAALVACGCLGPVLAQAEAPAPSAPPPINARQLGIADAILEYCKKAYPSSHEKWEVEVSRLTRGASAKTLEEVRASDAYRQARAAEANFVTQVEPVNAKHVCTRSQTQTRRPSAKEAASGKGAPAKPPGGNG